MGWSEAFDEQGNAYYTNDETGETSWEKPADFGGGGIYRSSTTLFATRCLRFAVLVYAVLRAVQLVRSLLRG